MTENEAADVVFIKSFIEQTFVKLLKWPLLNGSTHLFALAEFCLIVAEHMALK